ncbi:MAG: hypothetical protein GY943_38025 [Chloroflexi bacterium]|nr:hypothetical protein [Chloroflexota bacterium]
MDSDYQKKREPFAEYSVVKVKHLNKLNRHFDGSNVVKCPPRIGDVGTILVVHCDLGDSKISYTVESVDENGFTLWLADFDHDELESNSH